MRNKRRRGAIPRITIDGRKVVEVRDEFERITGLAYTPFDVEYCTLQPYVGDTFLLAPEGMHNKDVYTLFTATKLSVGKQGTTQKPDEVFYDDKWFRVVKVKAWQTGVINHYECVVVELDEELP